MRRPRWTLFWLVLMVVFTVMCAGMCSAKRRSGLLEGNGLVGKSMAEVRQLVGEPDFVTDYRWYDLGPNGGHRGLIVYGVGDFERGIFLVHFQQGVVSDVGGRRVPEKFEDRPFDAPGWRSGTPERRLEMASDLLKSRLLVGKTEDEVVKILGPPAGVRRYASYKGVGGGIFGGRARLFLDDDWIVERQSVRD